MEGQACALPVRLSAQPTMLVRGLGGCAMLIHGIRPPHSACECIRHPLSPQGSRKAKQQKKNTRWNSRCGAGAAGILLSASRCTLFLQQGRHAACLTHAPPHGCIVRNQLSNLVVLCVCPAPLSSSNTSVRATLTDQDPTRMLVRAFGTTTVPSTRNGVLLISTTSY